MKKSAYFLSLEITVFALFMIPAIMLCVKFYQKEKRYEQMLELWHNMDHLAESINAYSKNNKEILLKLSASMKEKEVHIDKEKICTKNVCEINIKTIINQGYASRYVMSESFVKYNPKVMLSINEEQLTGWVATDVEVNDEDNDLTLKELIANQNSSVAFVDKEKKIVGVGWERSGFRGIETPGQLVFRVSEDYKSEPLKKTTFVMPPPFTLFPMIF